NKEAIKRFFRNKTVRVVAVCVAALLLLIAVWRVFFAADNSVGSANGYLPTEREARLSVLLSRIEGVESVTVMIGEENGAPVNAVVVVGGEDGFVMRMRVIEATANALSIDPNRVLVYPA
ncbi:MAG: hypothetical protein K2H43_04280, partial [Clostridia bacterium]|nr:hypothetical protein [Clostridia bacterium]